MSTNQQIEHEQTVLGCLLVDNDCFDDIDLKTHEFSVGCHRTIYAAISEFLDAGKPVDLILLAEHLDKQGTLESVGNLKYIGGLVQNAASTKTIKSHAKRISEAHKRGKLKELVSTLGNMVDSREDIDRITEAVEAGLTSLAEGTEEETFTHIKKAVADAIDWEDSDEKGLSTGLRDLDWMTKGFKNSELIIIAGRPSMGKSTLAFQIAEHVANKEPVIIFSLEMSRRQVAARFLKYHENRVGKAQAVNHLYSLNLHIEEKPAITLGHIRSKCREIKRKHGLSMIVVDYLQLMSGEGDNRNQQIGYLSRGLKGLAKEFDMPVVALSQLSRKVDERSDKKPIMSDLRESGEIEQDADVILFIYRDEVYNKETDDKGLAEIISRKNRNGSIGEIVTKFSGELTRFTDFNGERVLRSVPTKKARAFED